MPVEVPAIFIFGIALGLPDIMEQQGDLDGYISTLIVCNSVCDMLVHSILVVLVVLLEANARLHFWNNHRNNIGEIQQHIQDTVAEQHFAKLAIDSLSSNAF